MEKFSARLRMLRESRGLTQDELADALRVSRSTIAGYEAPSKEREPNPHMLQRIADYFGVSVDYLLGRTDDPRLYRREAQDKLGVSDKITVEKRNQKGEVVETRVSTEALHKEGSYDDELPPEAIKQLEDFKEFLRQKYRKKP